MFESRRATDHVLAGPSASRIESRLSSRSMDAGVTSYCLGTGYHGHLCRERRKVIIKTGNVELPSRMLCWEDFN